MEHKTYTSDDLATILQKSRADFLDIVNKTPRLLVPALSACRNIITNESSNPEAEKFVGRAFRAIKSLLKNFKEPAAILLDLLDPRVAFDLAMANKLKNEIPEILTMCVDMFPFDKRRSTIKNLASLYKTYVKKELEYVKKDHSEFLKRAHKIRSLISKCNSIDSTDDIETRTELSIKIEEMLGLSAPKVIQEIETEVLDCLNETLEKAHQGLDQQTKAMKDEEDAKNKEKEKKKGKKKEEEAPLTIENPEALKQSTVKIGNVHLSQGPKLKEEPKIIEAQIEEVAALKKTKAYHENPLRKRTHFDYLEKIKQDEDFVTEFKDYTFPFDDERIFTLKKTICSFLNRYGGRIYLGITDAKVVKGILLSDKHRDLLILGLYEMVRFFEPPVMNDKLLTVCFIPIKDKQKKIIPDRYVVKVIVAQGNVDSLYSIRNDHIECYIRNQGQSVLVRAAECFNRIVERKSNLKREQVIGDEAFEDPEPEVAKMDEEEDGADLMKTSVLLRKEKMANVVVEPNEPKPNNEIKPGNETKPTNKDPKKSFFFLV